VRQAGVSGHSSNAFSNALKADIDDGMQVCAVIGHSFVSNEQKSTVLGSCNIDYDAFNGYQLWLE